PDLGEASGQTPQTAPYARAQQDPAAASDQAMPRTGGDEGARVTRVSPDEVIALGGPAKSDNPWSEESARALSRFYESGEAFLGYAREAAHAAMNAAEPRPAEQQRDHPAVSQT